MRSQILGMLRRAVALQIVRRGTEQPAVPGQHRVFVRDLARGDQPNRQVEPLAGQAEGARGRLQELLWHYARDRGLWRRQAALKQAQGGVKTMWQRLKGTRLAPGTVLAV